MRAQDVDSSGVFGDNIDDEIDVKRVGGPRVAIHPRVRQFGWGFAARTLRGVESGRGGFVSKGFPHGSCN